MRSCFAILCCILIAISCKENPKPAIKTAPISFTKEGNLSVKKASTDSVLIKLDIEIAETDYETQTGLMYRKGMETNQGMLFIFSDEAMHSFYMKNTEFPLDIIYINEDKTIASFQKNAKPYNEEGLSSKVPVKYVLEVNAGLSEKWQLSVGDKIEFDKI